MIKLLKYEMKNTKRFMLILLALICLASLFLMISIRNLSDTGGEVYVSAKKISAYMASFSVMISFAAMVTFFFYIASIMRKDLYDNRGYLTFALPLNGKQILGAKLCCAFLWTVIIGIIASVFALIASRVLVPEMYYDFTKSVSSFFKQSPHLIPEFLKALVVMITSGIVIYELIFLSLIIGKSFIAKYRMAGLWFVVFLVLMYLYGNLFSWLTPDSQLSLTRAVFGVGTYRTWNLTANILYDIIVGVGVFFISSTLLEKKVEI